MQLRNLIRRLQGFSEILKLDPVLAMKELARRLIGLNYQHKGFKVTDEQSYIPLKRLIRHACIEPTESEITLKIRSRESYLRVPRPYMSQRLPSICSMLEALEELSELGITIVMKDRNVQLRYPDGSTLTLDILKDHPELAVLAHMLHIYGYALVDHDYCDECLETLGVERCACIQSLGDKRVLLLPNNVRLLTHTIGCAVCIFETFFHRIHDVPGLRGATVIDVGAWVGDSALRFASLGASKVFAVEPDPVNFQGLIENIELNDQFKDRIKVLNLALGSGKILRFRRDYAYSGNPSAYILSSGEVFEVKSAILEELLDILGLEDVDYLKVDCKGCEHEMFKDPGVLRRFSTIKIEYTYNPTRLASILREQGFKVKIMRHEPFYKESTLSHGTIVASRQ